MTEKIIFRLLLHPTTVIPLDDNNRWDDKQLGIPYSEYMAKYDPNYGNLIWTHHVLERMKQRKIDQDLVYLTVTKSTSSTRANSKKAFRYRRAFGNLLVEAIAAKSDDGRWVVMSCWAKPVDKFRPKKPLWERILRKLFLRY